MAGSISKILSTRNTQGASGKKPQSDDLEPSELISRYEEISKHFPIGKRLSYFPEFQKDRTEETLILGYCINNLFVFAQDDIFFEGSDQDRSLYTKIDGQRRKVSRISKFLIAIPNPRKDEQKWDYTRRAELGKRGLFGKGNNLTLISFSTHDEPIHLDTTITRFSRLREGYFANVEIALLDPVMDTLSKINQRQTYRVQTSVPITMILRHSRKEIACDLLDFSERTARIGFYDPESVISALHDRQTFVMKLSLTHMTKPKEFNLVCETTKTYDSSIVVEIKGVIKNGKLENLAFVDALEIKSQLLSHPNTQR